MALDVNLRIDNAATHAAGTNNTSAVDTEGGVFAIIRMLIGTFTTTGDTLDTQIQASVNGGSNYFQIGDMPQMVDTEDDTEIARTVYIPRPDSGQTVTKVRLQHVVSAGGSAAITWSFVEPMTSLGVPALDEELTKGLALLT